MDSLTSDGDIVWYSARSVATSQPVLLADIGGELIWARGPISASHISDLRHALDGERSRQSCVTQQLKRRGTDPRTAGASEECRLGAARRDPVVGLMDLHRGFGRPSACLSDAICWRLILRKLCDTPAARSLRAGTRSYDAHEQSDWSPFVGAPLLRSSRIASDVPSQTRLAVNE